MKVILYLGSDPTYFVHPELGTLQYRLIHYPVIKIIPRSILLPEIKCAYDDLLDYTHLIFTSKNAVRVFVEHLEQLGYSHTHLLDKTLIAIGSVTQKYLKVHGLVPTHVAATETQEGVVAVMNQLDLNNSYVFLPRSALSRPVLTHYFKEQQIQYQACDLYDTQVRQVESVPDLRGIDEIIFTSPSTVHAFIKIFGAALQGGMTTLSQNKKLVAMGPITYQTLKKVIYNG